jgi:hypothetical protein
MYLADHQPTSVNIDLFSPQHPVTAAIMSLPQPKSAWLMLAISSGACAAFNGVFAKL